MAPSTHIARAVCKANQILGLIRRSFTRLDCQLTKQLLTALVRPHLEFGNVVAHPILKKDMKLLEDVQHRATRMVPGLSMISYEERLKLMDLHSLAYRRVKGDVIEAYKYLNGIYKVDCNDILPKHIDTGIHTRGHSLKLRKRSCVSRIRANVFGFRIVNLWNSLSEDVVSAGSTNSFKKRFDLLFEGRCFCETWEDKFWLSYGPLQDYRSIYRQHAYF